MEIQFGQIVEDSRGEALPDPDTRTDGKLTLARACEIALDTPLKEDQDETLKKKLERGRLIEQINEAAADLTPLTLKSEDITLLKERIGKIFTAASTVRRLCKLLDEATE